MKLKWFDAGLKVMRLEEKGWHFESGGFSVGVRTCCRSDCWTDDCDAVIS